MKARCFEVQYKDWIKTSLHSSMNISFLKGLLVCAHVVHLADMKPLLNLPSKICPLLPPPPHLFNPLAPSSHAFPPFPFLLFLTTSKPQAVTEIFHLTRLDTNSDVVRVSKYFHFKHRSHETGDFLNRLFHYKNSSSVFRPHCAGGIWNATITGHFGFLFGENSGRQITWLPWRHRLRF